MNIVFEFDIMLLQLFIEPFFIFITVNDPKAFESGETIVQFSVTIQEAISEGREETSDSTDCNKEANVVLVDFVTFPISIC